MYGLVLYEDYGRGEGNSEPKEMLGPFDTEAQADEYFKTNEIRLRRVYGSELTWTSLKMRAHVDLTVRIRERDKVLCKDYESGCNGKYGIVESISDKHQVAVVNFNNTKKIISYDDLEIQLL